MKMKFNKKTSIEKKKQIIILMSSALWGGVQ
jgi:hypothetical protein